MINLIKNKWLVLISLILLVFIIYYPSLKNDYVWDDVIIFVDRSFWHSDHNFWYMISQPVLDGTSYFRPLVFATFVAEFKLWGLKPFISHFINICILSFNVTLIYLIVLRISQLLKTNNTNLYALIVSLLYITNPILVESTVWAVGRFDLMVTSFILLGLLVFLNFQKNLIRDLILSIIFIFGLFCKELAIIFPVILFVFSLYFVNKNNFLDGTLKVIKENYLLFIFLTLSFFIYMCIRISAMHQIYHAVHQNLSEPLLKIPYIQILLPLNTLSEYIKTFFVPFYPNAIHQIDYAFLADWRGKVSSFFAIIFLVIVSYGFFKKNSFSAYMAVCTLLCLFPVLRIIPLGVPETIIHERFMTTALFFALLAVVFLPWEIIFSKLHILRLKKFLLSGLIAFYIIMGLAGIYVTIPMWQNNLILWQWAYKNNKNSEIALQSYLTYLFEYKRYSEFVKIIDERRRDITMNSEVLYYAYLLEHRDPETKKYIDGMINSLNPLHLMVKNRSQYRTQDSRLTEIGSIYHLNAYYYVLIGKDLNSALKNINIALWYDPENKQYLVLKSMILLGLGDKVQSNSAWNEAISDIHISKKNQFTAQKTILFSQMCAEHLVMDDKLCINKAIVKQGVQ